MSILETFSLTKIKVLLYCMEVKMKRIFSMILAMVLMFGFTATLAVGEETNSAETGTLMGTIFYSGDEDGAASGAKITLIQHNVIPNVWYYAICDENGSYTFNNLPPGEDYEIKIKTIGKTEIESITSIENISVVAGETTILNHEALIQNFRRGPGPCGGADIGPLPPIVKKAKVESVETTEYESSGKYYREVEHYFDDGKFFSAIISYASNKEETIKSYIALYNADGALHSVRTTEHEVTANKRFTLTTDSIKIPENQEVMYIKVFVWGEDGMPRGERKLYYNKSLFPFWGGGFLPVI